MGRPKENPRYNVLFCRASDCERAEIEEALGRRTVNDFLLEAALEKVRRDRQRDIDYALSQRPL